MINIETTNSEPVKNVIRPISETDGEFIEVNLFERKDSNTEKIYQVEKKISNKNRLILSKSKNPLNESHNLGCIGCFMKEATRVLIDANQPIKDIFMTYTNRLSLEKIDYSIHETKKLKQESVTLYFSICVFCGRKFSISFLKNEIEMFDLLVDESNRYKTEKQMKELDF